MASRSACAAAKGRWRMSSSVSAGIGSCVSGMLMPFSAPSRLPPGFVRVIRRVASPGPTASTTALIAPSSMTTGSPTFSAATASGSVQPIRGGCPGAGSGTAVASAVRMSRSPAWIASRRISGGMPPATASPPPQDTTVPLAMYAPRSPWARIPSGPTATTVNVRYGLACRSGVERRPPLAVSARHGRLRPPAVHGPGRAAATAYPYRL